MKLLYISNFFFFFKNSIAYSLPSSSEDYFLKYLDVFDSVTVIGRPLTDYLTTANFVPITDSRIYVKTICSDNRPQEIINTFKVYNFLEEEIRKSESIIVKFSSRRAIMAVKLSKKYKKPYMIEMTGDMHNALMRSNNFLKRAYANVFYNKVLSAIKYAPYGLYVSESYLQKKYPIRGEMCGCPDVIIDNLNVSYLENRIHKIRAYTEYSEVKLALVGFYQGNGKGVDTAIRALSHLEERFRLYVLGNGIQESRDKWYLYCDTYGVSHDRLIFPEALKSSREVSAWLANMDIFVLPSRSEGFGRVVVEAMAVACPCFVTNITSLPELVQSEMLIPLDGDSELAQKINTLINDKDAMVQIAKENFEKAKQFEFEELREKRNVFLNKFKDYAMEMRKIK